MATGDYCHGTHLFLAGQGQNYNIKSGLATARHRRTRCWREMEMWVQSRDAAGTQQHG